MSDEFRSPAPDPRVEILGLEFSQLSPADQALVLALVHRLGREVDTEEDYSPDVAFMDFEE